VTGAVIVRRATTSSRVGAIVGLAVVALLVRFAFGGAAATQTKVVEICVFVAVASMWNLLAGYTGLVSIGQQAYIGLGAYAVVVAVNGHGVNLYLAVPVAAVVAGAAAVPIGMVAFRLRGAYFAIGTWVIAEVVRLLVKQYKDDPIKGGSGTSIAAPTSTYPKDERFQIVALLAVVLAVGAVLVTYLILRSRLGLALQAVRDNESGARGLGVDVYRVRFVVYVVAALMTGTAGAIWYSLKLRVSPDTAFGVADWTAPIVVMVVIGGLGTIEGPIIGAIVWYLARDYVTDDNAIIYLADVWYLVATGAVAVLFALFVQRGLWGALQHRFPSLQLFPLRRVVDVGPDAPPHTLQLPPTREGTEVHP
jgi:branched-chain amino acid transport system permease protein